MHRSDDWFEGARINPAARSGFDAASKVSGNEIQAHGMAKEGTLGGAVQNLLSLLKNGLDPARGGGRLHTAPLVSKPGEGLVGATASGAAYNDGPFVLLQRPATDGLTGGLENLGAILVNQAHPEITSLLREAVHAIRPDVTVTDYSDAGTTVSSLRAESGARSSSEQSRIPKLPSASVSLAEDRINSLRGGSRSHKVEDGISSSKGFHSPSTPSLPPRLSAIGLTKPNLPTEFFAHGKPASRAV